jgi:DNA invertase Pin-like site-specific DNA recombinase
VAERSGWKVAKVYEDAGISGAKGRDQRPGLDALMKAVNSKEFDMVASWSVDRLGRSLTELLSILQALHKKGLDCFFISKDSTQRRPRAKPCFKCSACLPSSSGASFANG